MYQFPMYFPKGFDAVRARDLARLCQKAYELYEGTHQKPPLTKFEVEGYQDVTPFWGGFQFTSWRDALVLLYAWIRLHARVWGFEMFGYVARRGDDVFVVFRGTDSFLDWIGDVHMRQVPIDETASPGATGSPHWAAARMEQGVWRTYGSMRQQILKAVKALEKPGRRLFVTGHSLGAGLAIASVPDLLKNTKFSSVSLYTFAGPRVVNREFGMAMLDHRVECYRVVHVEDLVPAAPPSVPIALISSLMGGKWFYSHVGTPVDFGRAWTPNDTPTVQSNHEIKLYLAALEEHLSMSAVNADVAVLPASGTPARLS